MKKYINKFLKILFNLFVFFVIFLLLISFYAFIQTAVFKKNYANIFNFTLFEVKTGSMSPNIKVYDLVVVKILDQNQKNNLKIGDVISYTDKQYIVTHRIKDIDISEGIIVTKGDANNAEDSPIKKSDIIGKVIKTVPKVGIYRKVLLDKKVFSLICITLSLFAISFVLDDNPKNKVKGKIHG